MSTQISNGRRGLARLMLKVPALRGELQILSARNGDVLSLCEAFEEASAMLERLRKGDTEKNKEAIAEYETICSEIEQEIIAMCRK